MGGLALLTKADIADVMRMERMEGYDAFIGRFTAEEHRAELASRDACYLGWREGAELLGFTILQDLNAPMVLLRRIAVAEVGRGTGTRLFRAAVDWIFAATDAEAVSLHVRPGNDRARRIYAREGFSTYSSDETGERMSVSRAIWLRPKDT